MHAIADTGFVVAFVRQNDQHHAWALELAEQITSPLLTCEAVLAEAAFQLNSSQVTLSLLEEGMLRVAFDFNQQFLNVLELARRYADRHPDLADLCLIRMSELYPRHPVVTVDEADFRGYRRNRREVIPLICPPKHRARR